MPLIVSMLISMKRASKTFPSELPSINNATLVQSDVLVLAKNSKLSNV